MNKKRIWNLMAIAAALALAGCGGDDVSSSETGESSTDITSETSPAESSITETSSIENTMDAVLAALQGTVFAQKGALYVEGGYTDGSSSDSYEAEIESYWDGEAFYLLQTYDDGSTAKAEVYRAADGTAVNRYYNHDGSVYEDPQAYDEDNYVQFDVEYGNPFLSYGLEDLSVGEDGNVILAIAEEDVEMVSYFLTGHDNIPLEEIAFTVSGETISGAFETYSVDGDEYAKTSYSFALVDGDEIGFEKIEEGDVPEELAPLQDLFTSLQGQNYSMHVVRTGGYLGLFEYDTIETADTSLRSNTDTSGNTYYQGYYQAEEGLYYVETDGEYMIPDGYATTAYTLDSLRKDFSLSAILFDKTAENTFVLKSEYTSYCEYGTPDYRYHRTYLLYITAGTFTVTLTDQGAIFSYDYSYYDYGNLIEGTVTLTLTNIGNTTVPFTFVPYEEITHSSWDETNDTIVAILQKYLGDEYGDILPFIDFDYYSNAFDGESYGTIIYRAGTDVFDEFIAELVELDWELVKEDGYYRHEKADGSGYYNIRAFTSAAGTSNYIYLRFYAMTAE